MTPTLDTLRGRINSARTTAADAYQAAQEAMAARQADIDAGRERGPVMDEATAELFAAADAAGDALDGLHRQLEAALRDGTEGPEASTHWMPGLGGEPMASLFGTEGDPSGGEYAVPVVYERTFIDMLRARSALMAAGPELRRFTGGNLRIPLHDTGVAGGWYAEGDTITAEDVVLNELVLTPRKLAAYTELSREVIADSSGDALAAVERDHTRQLALAMDQAFLQGSGVAPEPTGLFNTLGVATRTLGSGNGDIPTLDDIAERLEALEQADADPERFALFMAPRTWSTFRQAKQGDGDYLIAPDPTVRERRSLFGHPVFPTTLVATDQTVGTSTDCSWIGVVDMSQVIVAIREGITVETSNQAGDLFQRDMVAVRTTTRVDIQVPNPEAVALLEGVRATT